MVALCANPNVADAWKKPLKAPFWLPFNSPELEKEFRIFDYRARKAAKAK